MTVTAGTRTLQGDLRTISLPRVISQVRRHGPLGFLNWVGQQSQGAITRLSLGPFRPYVVTRPEHLQHILRDHAGNYPRGAAMWSALGRLTGDGIGAEGPQWQASRTILKPAFSARHLTQMSDQLITAVEAGVDALSGRTSQAPVEAGLEMTRLAQAVINPLFFGSLVTEEDSDRLGEAVATAMGSLLWRMALPFVPHRVPLPGDGAFKDATRTVNQILHPVVAAARGRSGDQDDLIARLLAGVGADGATLTDQQVSDDIVAMWVAGSESSAIALTWIWVALAEHPHIADRVQDEVDQVVGAGPLRYEHVRQLETTRMVVEEVLRIHSVGWAVPRMAHQDDVIDGVPIPAGATLMISPYLTHRLEQVWDRPLEFDPDRFRREQVRARHPLAYLPFGDGAHQCLGQHVYMVEAVLIVAAMLRRFRIRVVSELPAQAKLSLTLQPQQPVMLTLQPRE
ncbi:cytochrome P450 [Actinomadura fulvescens]|uniref:Cytochrome P450 n=1 Tax=Actinomadura fulvescens TaxID=46160 RepID=A0ABP6DDY1_9ACTN